MFSDKDFGILIILYNPTKEDIKNTKKNISYFKSGILIWNSKKIFSVKNPKIREIELKQNLGQAKALNIGFKEALSMNINLILTLDQDSKLIEKSSNLIKIINLYSNKYINPACFSFKSITNPIIKKEKSNKKSPQICLTSITAGSIYLTSAWGKLKGFKNELFIEGIDTEFSIRAKKNKFNFYKFSHPIIIHDAGIPIKRNFLFFNLVLRKHSDIRIYLQYRNNLPTFIKNLHHFPLWSFRSLFNLLIKKSFLIMLGTDNILKTFLWIAKGVFHGLIETLNKRNNLKTQEYFLRNSDN